MQATTTIGFADSVHQAQTTFRAVMAALSRPGRAIQLPNLPACPQDLPAGLAAIALTLADYDSDGDLDMYLVNHSTKFFAGQEQLFKLKNNPEPDESDKLYRNNGADESGQISFEDVSETAGIRHFGFGLSAAIADFNQDGLPDIYVANDFIMYSYLYINQKDKTFKQNSFNAFKKVTRFAMGKGSGRHHRLSALGDAR